MRLVHLGEDTALFGQQQDGGLYQLTPLVQVSAFSEPKLFRLDPDMRVEDVIIPPELWPAYVFYAHNNSNGVLRIPAGPSSEIENYALGKKSDLCSSRNRWFYGVTRC